MPAMIYRSEPPIPADIITYRIGSKLVYVRPADNYEQALDYAQKEFPVELAGVSRDRIELYANAKMDGQRRVVRISEFAWNAAVARLMRGEVIDVCVRQLPDSKETAPPQYLEIPQQQQYVVASAPSSPKREPAELPTTRRSRSWFGKH